MSRKQCSSCKLTKPLTEFHRDNGKRSGYRSNCKACTKHWRTNRRQISKFDPNAMFECRSCYVFKPGREFFLDRTKPHGHTYLCKSCKIKYTASYVKSRKKTDEAFALKCRLFDALRIFVRKDTTAGGLYAYLGCDWKTFRAHLESLFEPGMTFDNYGTVWQVDHIAPCSMFNDRELYLCWWYKNLRPLRKRANWEKSDTVPVCKEVVEEAYYEWRRKEMKQ